MSQQPVLLAHGLTCRLPSDRILFQNVQVSLMAGDAARADRIALVGANGIGKSTLLKILAGQVQPTSGSVRCSGVVYYLPQISTVRQQIQHQTVFDWLSAVSEDWWTIAEILETQFRTTLDLSQAIAHLSGGELTKLFLAIGLSQNPDVLLLDEPTNHMDYRALDELRQFLQQFRGAFVIVSHKPFFLDQVVDSVWELSPEGIAVYGGNFSFYREQQQAMLSAKLRSHETAQKELKRVKTAAIQEQQRAAHSSKTGRQKFLTGSIDRMAAGGMKRKAEVTAGKLKQKQEAAIATATQKVVETKVRRNRVTQIRLEENHLKRKQLLSIQGANLWLDDRLLIQNISLHLAVGDRVAIAGANGSGKSSLMKAIVQHSNTAVFKSGAILRSTSSNWMYLDQTYALVDRDRTLLENMRMTNPTLSYQHIRQQLGHFLFFGETVDRLAGVLSGGELARLALAMISIAAIDLLILDEPTNNLDIPTVEQMIDAVNNYQGALLVISHDLEFLSQIQISEAFKIQNQIYQKTSYLPAKKEAFHQELLQAN